MKKFYEYPAPPFALDGTEVTIIEQEDTTASASLNQIIDTLVTTNYVKGLVNQIPLDELSDVVVTDPQESDVLTYSSGQWINAPSVANSLVSITDIGDVVIGGGVVNGDFLRYSNGDWVNETVSMVSTLDSLTDVTISDLLQGQVLYSDTGVWKNSTMLTLDANGVNIFGAVVEKVYPLSGTMPLINPGNGTIQTWTLTGASTPNPTLGDGESVTLLIDDGAAYTVNWNTIPIIWKTNGGVAPTLNTTGYTIISLFQVDGQVYGARIGDA
jgi:hypothetical protein